MRFLLLNRRLVGLGARALADTVPSRGAAAIFGRLLRQTVAELATLRYLAVNQRVPENRMAILGVLLYMSVRIDG